MPTPPRIPHPVQLYRQAQGLTQSELATRAGISRTAVTAIEGNRLTPSVSTALALARVFETDVESLFGGRPSDVVEPEWAFPPGDEHGPCWEAEVRGKIWRYPLDSRPMHAALPDSVLNRRVLKRQVLKEKPKAKRQSAGDLARGTLVLAGCDPAAGLLASYFQQRTGLRMVVLPCSSSAALDLLQQGKVHVAGVHYSTIERPQANQQAVCDRLGMGYQFLRLTDWQAGLGISRSSRVRSVNSAVKGHLSWVGREPGAAARQCLDELLPRRRTPQRWARDHRGVAEAIRCGWADVGVCLKIVSDEAGLNFLSLRWESYDLCFRESEHNDLRIRKLIQVVRESAFRKLLGGLPGYETRLSGTVDEI